MVRTERLDQCPLVDRFVELGRFEFKREGTQRAVMLLGEGGGRRGIEAAAEIGAHRHVRAHADARGVREQRFHPLARLCFAERALLSERGEPQLPVRRDRDRAVLGDELAARRQLEHVLEGGARRERRPEGEALVEPERVEHGAQAGVEEERFHL